MSAENLWPLIHAERAGLAEVLSGLDDQQWTAPSLCDGWTVEDTVAHLTAAANIGMWRWIRSMAGARFNADVHNRRRLNEYKGGTPAETLALFREAVSKSVAPTRDHAAWVGEVIVHQQDICRALGIVFVPSPAALELVAEFFAAKDFAVNSRTQVKGLRLEATDGSFNVGEGPVVSGSMLALAMVMAGRLAFCDELSGPGAIELRNRIQG